MCVMSEVKFLMGVRGMYWCLEGVSLSEGGVDK